MNTTAAISICSNALMLLGHTPISSFDEEGIGAQVAKNFYDTTYRAKLNEYSWNFAKKQIVLTKLAEPPLNDRMKYSYQLPSDHIRTITVYPHSDYTIVKDKIYSDRDNLELDYIYRVDESFLTPIYREALEAYLASKFAIPITENATSAQLYAGVAAKIFKQAKTIDSLEKPNRGSVDAAALPFNMRNSGRRGRGY